MTKAIQRGTAARAGHDPRALALSVIDRVLAGNETSQAALDDALRSAKLVPSDKNLCTQLVYGYLRQSIRLDWGLARYLEKPEKLPAEMLLILGLAAYELAFLRIPGYASVDWAVSRVRNRFSQGLSRVANAVLRRFQRHIKAFKDPAFYETSIDNPQERRAIWHSLPVWTVQLWEQAYGEETAALYMAAASDEGIPAVRVNATKDGAAELRNLFVAEHAGMAVGTWGVAFPQGAPYIARGLEKEGKISFQTAGVQEVLHVLRPKEWQGPIWDTCAGRGGKTAALLELGLKVTAASDTSAPRLQALPQEMTRLGLIPPECIMASAADAPFDGKFATIVIDAPCSGLGTLSRRPEIRTRRQSADIAGLIATQDAILDAAVRSLTPGGRIVYITCTVNPAENQERAAAFLLRHTAFTCDQEWATPPDSPWHEFFYAAVLRNAT